MGSLWFDIEVLADREEELERLFAELAAEDEGAEDDLPPIIQDEVPEWTPGERRHDCLSLYLMQRVAVEGANWTNSSLPPPSWVLNRAT